MPKTHCRLSNSTPGNDQEEEVLFTNDKGGSTWLWFSSEWYYIILKESHFHVSISKPPSIQEHCITFKGATAVWCLINSGERKRKVSSIDSGFMHKYGGGRLQSHLISLKRRWWKMKMKSSCILVILFASFIFGGPVPPVPIGPLGK